MDGVKEWWKSTKKKKLAKRIVQLEMRNGALDQLVKTLRCENAIHRDLIDSLQREHKNMTSNVDMAFQREQELERQISELLKEKSDANLGQ